MIGSNSTALRQHAYSVFTASRRERDGRNDIPESVLRPMAASAMGMPQTSRARPTPERLAEPKPGDAERESAGPKAGIIKMLTPQTAARGSLGPVSGSQPSQSQPTQEEIRVRAYQIFEARHGEPGDPVADWLSAETELRRERGLVR